MSVVACRGLRLGISPFLPVVIVVVLVLVLEKKPRTIDDEDEGRERLRLQVGTCPYRFPVIIVPIIGYGTADRHYDESRACLLNRPDPIQPWGWLGQCRE